LEVVIRDLNKRYSGGKYAVRDVSLEIHSGMFGLLGPNGAGKTTLMRILVTLLEPTSGEVTIDGLDIGRHRARIREMIGYLPQEFGLFSRLRTSEFLDYAAALAGIRSKAERARSVDRMLTEVGLFEARDRQVTKLSGGMKRRLGIAQSLIGSPRILVVDEPTVGLDPEERLRFRNLLTELSQQDMIIVLSTHIVGDISSTCNDMAVLNDGEIAYQGPPEGMIAQARGRVWVTSAPDTELDQLRERFPVISTVPAVQGYEVRLVSDEPPDDQARQLEPNLEDAYISFMQKHAGETNVLAETEDW
jgi:ABC-type multidrug transport system ATPase subunit